MSATIPTPATTRLAEAVRNVADQLSGDDTINAFALLCAFARVLEGKDLGKAMGAPGDWGYGTPIGDAVLALLREPGFPPRLIVPEKKGDKA